jgi:hypothetical protein
VPKLIKAMRGQSLTADLADQVNGGIEQFVELVLTGESLESTHRHIFSPFRVCHLATTS